jgi:hypothetical protein
MIEVVITDERRVNGAVSIIGIEKIGQPVVEFGVNG